MSGTQKYYIEANDNLQGYDVLKRDGVIDPETGRKIPEKILTLYSLEYLDQILEALNAEDIKGREIIIQQVNSPIYEV